MSFLWRLVPFCRKLWYASCRRHHMNIVKRNSVLIIYTVCILLMAAGTFLDQTISKFVFNDTNKICIFLAAVGEWPMMLNGWISAGLLYAALPDKKDKFGYYLCIGLMACGILGGCIALLDIKEMYSGSKLIMCMAGEIILAALCAFGAYKFADRSDLGLIRRTAIFLLFTVAFTAIFITALKIPWARPRYSYIRSTEGLQFQKWYKIGSAQKAAFGSTLDHEAFKSFPSGHTGFSTTLLATAGICGVIPAFREKEYIFSFIAMILIIVIAASRIVMGAHFLTDVTFAFMLVYTITAILYKVLKVDEY